MRSGRDFGQELNKIDAALKTAGVDAKQLEHLGLEARSRIPGKRFIVRLTPAVLLAFKLNQGRGLNTDGIDDEPVVHALALGACGNLVVMPALNTLT
ncbi:hypothetical protein C266_25855 [Pandoraea sp. SD6-2]|nr:hypothetical protein C266_25855 [Pandoraea sp. SD6-2]